MLDMPDLPPVDLNQKLPQPKHRKPGDGNKEEPSPTALEEAWDFTKSSSKLLHPTKASCLWQGWKLVQESTDCAYDPSGGIGVLMMAATPVLAPLVRGAGVAGVAVGGTATAGLIAVAGGKKVVGAVKGLLPGSSESVPSEEALMLTFARRVSDVVKSHSSFSGKEREYRIHLVRTVAEGLLELAYDSVDCEPHALLSRGGQKVFRCDVEDFKSEKRLAYFDAMEKVKTSVQSLFEGRKVSWNKYIKKLDQARQELEKGEEGNPLTPGQQALLHSTSLAQEIVSDPLFQRSWAKVSRENS